ncbi:MAG TPA: septation protein SpoVG family protein [Planctomycetota bacterium]|nr:septation protein SpoVG family protein [Planctomycetota bacterium]
MVVTEVKIKLVPNSDSKLLAFASVTFDRCFVVRDIKIIQGNKSHFVAMPSRKITDHCKKCGAKNHLQALFCNHCGTRLPEKRTRPDGRGRAKLHADIAHPINVRCRQDIQEAILKGYMEELERSRQPGYVPTSYDDFDAGPEEMEEAEAPLTSDGARTEAGGSEQKQPQAAKAKPADPSKGPADAGGFGILG